MCSLWVYFFANFSYLCSLRYAFQVHRKLCVLSGHTISRFFDRILCSFTVRVRLSGGTTPSILVPSATPPPTPRGIDQKVTNLYLCWWHNNNALILHSQPLDLRASLSVFSFISRPPEFGFIFSRFSKVYPEIEYILKWKSTLITLMLVIFGIKNLWWQKSLVTKIFGDKNLWWQKSLVTKIFSDKNLWWQKSLVTKIFGDKNLWWQKSLVTKIFGDKNLWWQKSLVTKIFGDKNLWWQKSLVTKIFGDKNLWWQKSLVTKIFGDKNLWWQKSLVTKLQVGALYWNLWWQSFRLVLFTEIEAQQHSWSSMYLVFLVLFTLIGFC